MFIVDHRVPFHCSTSSDGGPPDSPTAVHPTADQQKRLLVAIHGSSFHAAIEDEARVQHIAYTTADMAEGITAFMERREPRFTGQ